MQVTSKAARQTTSKCNRRSLGKIPTTSDLIMSINQTHHHHNVGAQLLLAGTTRRGRRRRKEALQNVTLLLATIVCHLISASLAQRIPPESQFCQPQTVGQRLVGQQAADWTKKVFCFYDIQDEFRPQDLNPCLCTHVVYSYVAVRKNLSFIAGKKGDLRSLASLKRKNPNLKLLVSLRPDDYFSFEHVASGAESATNETSIQMNEMHQKFAKRIRDFIVRHSLDGINLDWPYFAQTMPSANASREHLTLVLKAINENFKISLAQSSPSAAYLRLQSPIVTLTTSKDFYSIVDGYDFHQINRLLDFVHLPAFDFDLNVDQFSIGHPARLHGISDAENLDTLVDLLLSSGLPSEQLVAGVPSHGVQITSKPALSVEPANPLASSADGSTNSTAIKPNSLEEQLEAAANISIVSHSEVCRIRNLAKANCTNKEASGGSCWTVSRARDLTAPFAYDSEHWIGFDDETSVKLKAKYVLLRHLAGVAMFTVNNDDPAGVCGFGSYPLLATVNGVFARAPLQQDAKAAESSPRAYFTSAPNQILTATSLMSQIFGKKQSTTPTPSTGDLMSSASEQRDQQVAPSSQASSATLMSFVDIIEKYGAVNRLDASSAGPKDAESLQESQLACDKIGYQRYPRDCSRFYRCVQTPPVQKSPDLARNQTEPQAATTTITRLQYECPSGLVFDEQYQICNWPSWSAQCTGSGEVNLITNAKFVCPNYGYFQNQENCEYFYYCSDYNRGQSTQAYQFRCPFELGFDEEKLQCNWKWLVKGCNVSSPSSQQAGQNTSSELAQKYLKSLNEEGRANLGAPTTTPTTITTPTTTTPTTTTPTATTLLPQQTSTNASEEKVLSRSRRSAGEDLPEERAITSRVTSFLASIAAYREHKMKKSNQQGLNSGGQKPGSSTVERRGLKYPNFVGAPQMPSSSSGGGSSTSFRTRRRQASATITDEKLPEVLPYKPRPPPPSIFPALPSSAIYMLVDSLRSYGEAIQSELNRYLRIAGDRMRVLLGPRGATSAPSRRTEPENMQELLGKLGVGRWRVKRNAPQKLVDLQAMESAVEARQATMHRHQQYHRDPLGRPAGYPLNPLDKIAEAAVTGPEPKLYSQPSALISNQMSGISQQDYERLIRSNRDAFNMYKQQYSQGQQFDHAYAASVVNKQVLPPPPEFNRESGNFGPNQPEIPFGMPSLQGSKALASQNVEQAPESTKKRRSTMGMKLASLARPTGFTPFIGNLQGTTTKSATTKGYISFLPTLSNAVVAPARNIMSRAKDLNKAVHDLISTLAPGNKNTENQNKQQHRLPATTPMPNQHQFQHHSTQMKPLESNQNPFVVPQVQSKAVPELQQQQQPKKEAGGPLLLTEHEARALSAQLDQLSKEQLEELSSKLNEDKTGQMLQQSSAQDGQQDYATRLLKLLSATSHNPEDVKLLDQLSTQLKNYAANDPLIEIGQPDDLALLEALGLIPQGSSFKRNNSKYSIVQDQQAHAKQTVDNANAASYSNYQTPADPKYGGMKKGSMKKLLNDFPQYQNYAGALSSTTYSPVGLYETEAPPAYKEYQEQQPYHPQPYYTTTTTTTPQPFVVTQVTEEVVEKKAPPVKQTYTELIESNVTTPDGIETSFETRTKSAVSAGAGFSINSQVGIGMIPKAFEGAIPFDSPQYEASQSTKAPNVAENTTSTTTTPSNTTGTLSVTGKKKSKASKSGTKLGSSTGASSLSLGGPQFGGEASQFGNLQPQDGQFQNLQFQDGQFENGQFLDGQQVSGFGNQFGQDQFPDSNQAGLEFGGELSGALEPSEPPPPAGTSFQRQISTSNGIRPGLLGGATLNNYNFATQPMSQFEEVVIKKKFKPFPKQVMVPQTKEFTVEEVRKEVTPPPVVQQTSFIQEESFGNRQQPLQQVVESSLSQDSAAQQAGAVSSNAASFDSSSASLGGSSDSRGFATDSSFSGEQQKEDFSTIASTFGEPAGRVSSLTKQELQQSQQQQEEKRAQDYQMFQFLLEQQRLQQQQQPIVDLSSNSEQFGGKTNPRAAQELENNQTASSLASERIREAPKRKSANKKSKKKKIVAASVSSRPAKNDTSFAAESKQTSNRVEAAFSNFMVELQRSRNGTSTSGANPVKDEQNSEQRSRKKRKSRSKKGSNPALNDARSELKRQDAPQLRKKSASKVRAKAEKESSLKESDTVASGSRISRTAIEVTPSGTEQVAIYGTKSGFMPIIRADNLNYQQPRNNPDAEPLSSSASFTSSKHEAPEEMSVAGKRQAADQSWKNFVRRLSDQISVVNLGNYSEANRQIQVKLVILPASPNNQLLQADNWNQLASHYPQLFPANQSALNIGPVELGESSVSIVTGLIDKQREDARNEEFTRQYEKVSRLIEVPTFKALDEIIQRSSGRLFMMERKSDASRTMIAVIPDKPLIKQKGDGGSNVLYHYQREVKNLKPGQISATTTTTTTTTQPPAALAAATTTPSSALDDKQAPRKAAAFSRAIQESIQEAIRQHYDSVKSQLKKSLSEPSKSTTAKPDQERLWSTPAPETLAHMESALAASNVDALEASGSSTEFSMLRLADATTNKPFNSHAIFELDGAEPKALYGLDMSSQQADQSVYFKSSALKQLNNNETATTTTSSVEKTSQQATKAPPARFISIGSHLIGSPLKLPKVVDQAYVNHFYDHISEHQLAREAGFEEISGSAMKKDGEESKEEEKEKEAAPNTSITEDLLVPESACTRAGLFQHPFACNKFYECFWDKQLNKFTLHMFECPIKLAFDDRVVGCATPIESSLCVNY